MNFHLEESVHDIDTHHIEQHAIYNIYIMKIELNLIYPQNWLICER